MNDFDPTSIAFHVRAIRTMNKRNKSVPASGSASMTPAARLALKDIGDEWQKIPHHIRASHIAVLIRQGHIEHRWTFDLYTRIRAGGSYPWLREGEIRKKQNTQISDPQDSLHHSVD